MFGFAGNFFPLNKMYFFKKIGPYCGLCCFVYMFSEGTNWIYARKIWRRILLFIWDRLWDDHIPVLLIHELGQLIRKPQKSICIVLAPIVALVQQVSYYLSCWFCNLISVLASI